MYETKGPSEESAAAAVQGLHHYTISVAGLDGALDWYKRVLGFKLVYQSTRHPWGQVAYMQAPGFLLEVFAVEKPNPLPSYAAGPEPDTDLSVCGHKHFALLHANVAVAERTRKPGGESTELQTRPV